MVTGLAQIPHLVQMPRLGISGAEMDVSGTFPRKPSSKNFCVSSSMQSWFPGGFDGNVSPVTPGGCDPVVAVQGSVGFLDVSGETFSSFSRLKRSGSRGAEASPDH
ncbi:hypothetical protein QAD02_003102 [Eretmocerus hayati]|uniref:Uncharacterized protein n=1 Tax=Eretmocerus hayati TaxID=131215 RepID=A0ACC2NKX3_9HYME|nr:hypothetical protein QAD02_003102 [Eretmocerus hayati]